MRVNVGKSKVMRCSRYINVGRMETKWDNGRGSGLFCFKYFGSNVAADGACEKDSVHRMNEGYKA